MQSIKILEMINQGQIEELKGLLQDEIYQDELKKKSGAKQRYSAMKKYFGYTNIARVSCQKPAIVEHEGKMVTSFCNSYSLALTSESPGNIELFTEENDGVYPNVSRLIKRNGWYKDVNLDAVLAEAKSKGYKLTKREVNGGQYLMHYNGAYFRLGLIHATYAIIADGNDVTFCHDGKNTSSLVIDNQLGTCLVLPFKCDEDFIEKNNITVINVE